MNWVIVAGHLGADAEEKMTTKGTKVVTFRIASNVRKSGKEETMWWRVTVWGDRFDKMIPYLKKGGSVIVSGEMSKPEIFTDRNGHQQISLDLTADSIKFSPFGRSGGTQGGGERSESSPRGEYQDSHSGGGAGMRAMSFGGGSGHTGVAVSDSPGGDDEIPF
jgi:single-strand DNA-binding protein